MKLWIAFIGLTLVYLAIGGVILFLISKLKGKDPWKYLAGKDSEDRWFWVLCGMTVVAFAVAWSNGSGPALLLPEKHPSPETIKSVKGFFQELWTDEVPAPPKSVTSTPKEQSLPWATGTWFWWTMFLVYLILIPVFGVIAFQDNVRRGIAKVMLRRKPTAPQGSAAGTQTATAPQGAVAGTGKGQGFGARLVVEFLAEIVAEILIFIFMKKVIK